MEEVMILFLGPGSQQMNLYISCI